MRQSRRQQEQRLKAHEDRLKRLRKVRPTKASAGMTATLERQRASGTHRGYHTIDTPTLAVYGTLDLLRRVPTVKGDCPCCGAKSRGHSYSLTEAGKKRLKALRRLRAERTPI